MKNFVATTYDIAIDTLTQANDAEIDFISNKAEKYDDIYSSIDDMNDEIDTLEFLTNDEKTEFKGLLAVVPT